jgi:hypothetical protein
MLKFRKSGKIILFPSRTTFFLQGWNPMNGFATLLRVETYRSTRPNGRTQLECDARKSEAFAALDRSGGPVLAELIAREPAQGVRHIAIDLSPIGRVRRGNERNGDPIREHDDNEKDDQPYDCTDEAHD